MHESVEEDLHQLKGKHAVNLAHLFKMYKFKIYRFTYHVGLTPNSQQAKQ